VSEKTWKAWGELTDEDQENLVWLIDSLRRYDAGRRLAQEIRSEAGRVDFRLEFLTDCTHVYFYAYYAHPEKSGILPIFRSIGCADLAERIAPILARPIGAVTFIEALCVHRARLITHQRFSFGDFQAELERHHLHTPENLQRYWDSLRDIQNQTCGFRKF